MKRNLETWFYLAVLVVGNLSLLWQVPPERLYYHPPASGAFAWWQLLTHAFVHVSLYHAILDGAAFMLLYRQLSVSNIAQRTALVIGCMAGSLIGAASELSSSSVSSFCGLSGVAHGLMAVCALEMMAQKKDLLITRIGWICFVGLLLKCIYEAISGQVFFGFMHQGQVGIPLVWSHSGGVLGGLLTYGLLQLPRRSHLGTSGARCETVLFTRGLMGDDC